LPGTNTLAYLASSSATKEKSFVTLTPGVLGRGLLEVDPAPVVAPVGVVERFNDEEGGNHLGSSLGSRSRTFCKEQQ
jgi:hypothetical protein